MKIVNIKLLLGILAMLSVASSAVAQTTPPLWNSTTSYKIGDLVTYEGNSFQCQANETASHPNPHSPGWGVYFVYSGFLVIPVGPSEAFKTLSSAWIYIKNARIGQASAITLSLDKTYVENFSNSFSLDHPFGAQIFIIGTNSGQTANFTKQTAGFVLDSGHVLGGLEGIKITAPNGGSKLNAGVLVTQKAVLSKLSGITIQNFDYGIEANSGEIDNVSAISFSQFQVGGVLSTGTGGLINFSAAVLVEGTNNTSGPPGFGFSADSGGTMNCPSCIANNCQNNFVATNGGTMFCSLATASSSSNIEPFESCFYVSGRGAMYAENSTAKGAIVSYSCDTSSFINATFSNASGYNMYAYQATLLSGIIAIFPNGGTDSNIDASSYLKS